MYLLAFLICLTLFLTEHEQMFLSGLSRILFRKSIFIGKGSVGVWLDHIIKHMARSFESIHVLGHNASSYLIHTGGF